MARPSPTASPALGDTVEAVLAMPEDEYQALHAQALAVAHTFSWEAVVEKRLRYYRNDE